MIANTRWATSPTVWTDRNGSSKGAYDIWWGARSDWNHHNEKAAFIGVDRNLDDFLPFKGFSVGAGAAMGWDGEAYGTAQHLKEWAFNFDIGYTHPEGPLEGAFIKLHFTEYCNGTNLPSWGRIKTAFSLSVISSPSLAFPFRCGGKIAVERSNLNRTIDNFHRWGYNTTCVLQFL